jgi:ABC-2 type transport system permease protein
VSAPAWWLAARHTGRLLRRQTLVWGLGSAVASATVVQGYVQAYPTQAERVLIARQIGGNPGFQALYGQAHRLETIGGFSAWRIGGLMTVFFGIWGLLASTRMLRGEEDAGHAELLLSTAISRRGLFAARLVALAAADAVVLTLTWVGLVAAGLEARPSIALAAMMTGGAVVFGAAGALAAQVMSTRRQAAAATGVVLGASYLIRVAADGSRTLGALRWATPLGWLEMVRPFSGTRLGPVLPIAALVAAALVASTVLAGRRDVGRGFLGGSGRGRSQRALLSSPEGFAVRSSIGSAVGWLAGVAAFGLVMGLLAKGVSEFIRDSPGFARFAERLASADLASARGFVSLSFAFFVLPIGLVGITSLSAAREEEASGRLDTLLSQAITRRRWFGSRVMAALGSTTVVAVGAGLAAWGGLVATGAGVGVTDMVVAGLNCVPPAALFVGLAAAAYASVPRLATGLSLGLLVGAYLLQLLGALLDAPGWVLDLSPFHHVTAAPVVPVNVGAAVTMLAIAAMLLAAAAVWFDRRDVVGA